MEAEIPLGPLLHAGTMICLWMCCFYTKTIWAQYCSEQMEKRAAWRPPNILRQSIFSSSIRLTNAKRGDRHQTWPHRANADGFQHWAESRLGLPSVRGTRHGHSCGLQGYGNYEGKVPLVHKVSMPPLTEKQPASQECVEGSGKSHTWAGDGPTEDGSLDVEAHLPVMSSEPRAPFKIVDVCPWSPGVYRALCLVGKTLDVVWERAFNRTSHFWRKIFDY